MASATPARTGAFLLLLRILIEVLLPRDLLGVATHASRADSSLQRYGQVLSYLIYENTTYWTRSNLLLLAHTALLGFTAIVVPPFSQEALPERVLLLAVMGAVGLVLTHLWWIALRRGSEWIEHWHRLLLRLEPEAYGEIYFFRGRVGPDVPPARHSARQVAHYINAVFGLIWSGTFAYALVLVGLLLGL